MKIIVGSDASGLELAHEIAGFLQGVGHNVVFGRGERYPYVAHYVARRVASGERDRGVLICETGLGMAMMANKVPGAWAATPQDLEAAVKMARSNHANIITIGSGVTCATRAKGMVLAWLETKFADRPNAQLMKQLAAT